MKLINVSEITAVKLGKILVKYCGNEGRHPHLNETERVALRFLQEAIDFVPSALEMAGDLRNASFLFAHPGNEFVIKAGDGEWEFYFSQRTDGTIHGRCVHMPNHLYVLEILQRLLAPYLGIPIPRAITDS